jgi:hypothetical protein
MDTKRYQVVYTGKLVAGMDPKTVISNLVLDVGLSEERVRALLQVERAVLKRFASPADANKVAAKLERAGLVCRIEDVRASDKSPGNPDKGESSLLSLFSRISPVARKS